MRVAVLITCHNRRNKTLACLAALMACIPPEGWELGVYLVDDGSCDGTTDAVRSTFSDVNIIEGDGSLFWNGGMRLAFAKAIEGDHDAYLWLNDDTILDENALLTLSASSVSPEVIGGHDANIIVGATRDPDNGKLTYGGLVSRSRMSPHYYVPLPAANYPQPCQTLNGNCVFVPKAVVQAIGNIDGSFVHAIGDWDYGFRARQEGFGIWMAPGFVGTCSQNPPAQIPLAEAANVRLQLRRVCSPKRVPPKAWKTFVRRHYGPLWPIYFVRPYAATVIRALSAKFKRRQL